MSFSSSHNGYFANGVTASSVHTDSLDLGYAEVQQLVNFAGAVTVNAPAGRVILDAAATLAAGAAIQFTITNSQIRRNSLIFLQWTSDGTGAHIVLQIFAKTAGSATVEMSAVGAPGIGAGAHAVDFLILHVD